MIGYVRGKVLELTGNEVLILTQGGVGYEIGINELISTELSIESEVSLFIHHHITENSQSLFGFLEAPQKRVFRELLKISGVGGKVAMQILTLGIHNLLYSVKNEDNKMIESVKGVGKKMAEKIIIELKDKEFDIVVPQESSSAPKIDSDIYDDIKNTLCNMGYNPRDIDRYLSEIPDDLTEVGTILPYMIKHLS